MNVLQCRGLFFFYVPSFPVLPFFVDGIPSIFCYAEKSQFGS